MKLTKGNYTVECENPNEYTAQFLTAILGAVVELGDGKGGWLESALDEKGNRLPFVINQEGARYTVTYKAVH